MLVVHEVTSPRSSLGAFSASQRPATLLTLCPRVAESHLLPTKALSSRVLGCLTFPTRCHLGECWKHKRLAHVTVWCSTDRLFIAHALPSAGCVSEAELPGRVTGQSWLLFCSTGLILMDTAWRCHVGSHPSSLTLLVLSFL